MDEKEVQNLDTPENDRKPKEEQGVYIPLASEKEPADGNGNKAQRNTKRIIGIVIAAVLLVIIGVVVVFASVMGGAKGDLSKAVVKTAETQQARSDAQLEQFPALAYVQENFQGNRESSFRMRLKEISGFDESEALNAMLKNVGLGWSAKVDDERFRYDYNLTLQDSKLLDLFLYEDTEKVAFALPDAISGAYYIDMATAVKDFENSVWAKSLSRAEFDEIISMLQELQSLACFSEQEILDFGKTTLKFGKDIYKRSTVTKKETAAGATYLVQIPGSALNGGFVEWLKYALLESPLEPAYREIFHTMYSEEPTGDPNVFVGTYEEFVQETLNQMNEEMPEIDYNLTILANQDDIIQSYTGEGTLVPGAGTADMSALTGIKIDGKIGEQTSFIYSMKMEENGKDSNMDFTYNSQCQDKLANWLFGFAIHDDVTDISFGFAMNTDAGANKLGGHYDLAMKDQDLGNETKLSLGLETKLLLADDAVRYQDGSLYFDMADAYEEGGQMVTATLGKIDLGFEGTLKPLAEPLEMPRDAKNIITLTDAEITDLGAQLSGYMENLTYRVLGILMGGFGGLTSY